MKQAAPSGTIAMMSKYTGGAAPLYRMEDLDIADSSVRRTESFWASNSPPRVDSWARYGNAIENLEHSQRVKYVNPANET